MALSCPPPGPPSFGLLYNLFPSDKNLLIIKNPGKEQSITEIAKYLKAWLNSTFTYNAIYYVKQINDELFSKQ